MLCKAPDVFSLFLTTQLCVITDFRYRPIRFMYWYVLFLSYIFLRLKHKYSACLKKWIPKINLNHPVQRPNQGALSCRFISGWRSLWLTEFEKSGADTFLGVIQCVQIVFCGVIMKRTNVEQLELNMSDQDLAERGSKGGSCLRSHNLRPSNFAKGEFVNIKLFLKAQRYWLLRGWHFYQDTYL